tara:strand:+ start:3470 stop:3709 length:240 start_codon:yes stop_codon:yes gene_type:complete
MRMSELVSSLGLSIYPIIGLIGFGTAFLFILLRAMHRTRDEMAANAAIPLEDGTRPVSTTSHAPARASTGCADANGSDA